MADETTAATAENTSEGDGKNTTATAEGAGTQAASTEAKTFTQQELDRIVKTRIAEEKKRLEKAASDAKLDESERLKKQLEAFEEEKKTWAQEKIERDARDTVIAALSDDSDKNTHRAKSPNTARAIFKLIKDDLEYDDKGEILNLTQVLQQAKKDYSDLFAGKSAGSADGGRGSQLPVNGDMNALIRQSAGRT